MDTKPIIVGLIPKSNIPKNDLNCDKHVTSHRHTLICRRKIKTFNNDLYLDNYLSLQLPPKNTYLKQSKIIVENRDNTYSRRNSIIEDSIDFTKTLRMWRTVERNAKKTETILNKKCKKDDKEKKTSSLSFGCKVSFNFNLARSSNSFKYEKISRNVSFRSDSKSIKRSFKDNFLVDLKKLMRGNIKKSINAIQPSSLQKINKTHEENLIEKEKQFSSKEEFHEQGEIEVGLDLCDVQTNLENHFEKSMSMEEIKKELMFYRENSTLRKSNPRLRMEKLILLKTLKSEQSAKNTDHNNLDLTHSTSLYIKNLQFYIKNENSKHYVYYYMCTITQDNNILSTEVVKPIKNSIYFNDEIKLDGINKDSSLTVNLYCMKIKISKENRFLTFSRLVKRKISLLMNWNQRREIITSIPESLSDFNLLGSATFINFQELKLNSNNISKTVGDFESGLKDNKTNSMIEGLFSVGIMSNNNLLWKKRWFYLEGDHNN